MKTSLEDVNTLLGIAQKALLWTQTKPIHDWAMGQLLMIAAELTPNLPSTLAEPSKPPKNDAVPNVPNPPEQPRAVRRTYEGLPGPAEAGD